MQRWLTTAKIVQYESVYDMHRLKQNILEFRSKKNSHFV